MFSHLDPLDPVGDVLRHAVLNALELVVAGVAGFAIVGAAFDRDQLDEALAAATA